MTNNEKQTAEINAELIKEEGNGSFHVSFEHEEYSAKAKELLNLRSQADKLEKEIIDAFAQSSLGKALTYLGHQVNAKDSYGAPKKYRSRVIKSFSGNPAISVQRIDKSYTQYVAPMDPKTINLLLTGKLLSDAEKRALLVAEFGSKLGGVLDNHSVKDS